MSGHGSWDWSDWHSQVQHTITTVEELREWIRVTPAEEAAIAACQGRYRWAITPYYAALMDRDDPRCPIRQQAVPSLRELESWPTASVDPVGDTVYRRTNRVIHKYPDRVVILVTGLCPVYCRHCTRKYHTMTPAATYFARHEGVSWEEDFAYILTTFPLLDRDQPPLPGEPRSFITRDQALLALFELRRKPPPEDIVAFFAQAGADIAPVTGPLRDLRERVLWAWELGAVAYVPSRRGGEEAVEEVETSEIEGEEFAG